MTGLPLRVIETIQSTRAPSTRSLYGNKWCVFEKCRDQKQIIPYQCSVSKVLCFLQDLLNRGEFFSAISAFHIVFDKNTVEKHPLLCCFMNGACRLRPIPKSLVLSWDLSIMLEAISQQTFETLENMEMKYLSFKTALLAALTSKKRVSELHAPSVHFTLLLTPPLCPKVSGNPPAAFPSIDTVSVQYACCAYSLLCPGCIPARGGPFLVNGCHIELWNLLYWPIIARGCRLWRV